MKQVQKKIWQEPIVWMLASGPLIVVVAGLATWRIASLSPDRIEKTAPVETVGTPVNNQSAPAMMPARSARNHAATSTAPKTAAP